MAAIPLGIQLYTVRDVLKDDFRGTLEALAEMGYQGVEFAWNYGGMQPQELAAMLKKMGLTTCGLHVKLKEISKAGSESYAYAAALGSEYITTSLLREVAKDWHATIQAVAAAAKTAADAGLTFTYHNHAQEFDKIDGEYALDLLYSQTDASQVQAELDTYWIQKGGEDPAAYVRKYAGRVPQVHLKDMDRSDGSFAEVGEGVLDIEAIYAAARQAGARWVIVEQDTCKRPPLQSARISIENLKKAGLA